MVITPFKVMSWLARALGIGYNNYQVLGFTYRVDSDNNPSPSVAYRLHEVNERAIDIISFVRRWVEDAERRGIEEEDGVEMNRLRVIYDRLAARYDPDVVYESKAQGDDTSFVINQGEELHMCVRVRGAYERDAVLTSVLVHELAHIGSVTPDHDEDFWDNYSILQKAVSKMGFVNVKDIPMGGALYCNKIHIGEDELREISKSGYTSVSSATDLDWAQRYVAQPCARGLCTGSYVHPGLVGRDLGYERIGEITVPDYGYARSSLQSARQRYEDIDFDPHFPELHKHIPVGFSTEHPLVIGAKVLQPIPSSFKSCYGRMERRGSAPNPISIEMHSYW